MPKYSVNLPIEHENVRYEPGDTVEMNEEYAKYHGERLSPLVKKPTTPKTPERPSDT